MYNLDGSGIYLLAHVKGFASNIKVGKVYHPGDVVAFIGGSGANKDGSKNENRWKAHLHLSYYDYQFEPKISLVSGSGEDCVYVNSAFLNKLNNPLKHDDRKRMENVIRIK